MERGCLLPVFILNAERVGSLILLDPDFFLETSFRSFTFSKTAVFNLFSSTPNDFFSFNGTFLKSEKRLFKIPFLPK